jgi:hypothetical protein
MSNVERGLYCDTRQGREYWYIGHPRDADMRIAKGVLNAVMFLAVEDAEGKKIKGTAFAVAIVREGVQHVYLVTARHCVERARAKYDALFVRVNARHGGAAKYIQVPFDWVVPDDPTVDVAVLPAPPELARFEVTVLHEELFGTDKLVEQHGVSLGDDVVIVGLFAKRAGKNRNAPIVRAGTIAAMPDEPLYDDKTGLSYRGYLVEVRSTAGLSGSPVTAYLGYHRDGTGQINRAGREVLIGVVRGHWRYMASEFDEEATDAREDVEAVNSGIAIATPFQEVINLLYSETLMRKREERAYGIAERNEPTLDWDEDEPRPGPEPERLKIKAPMDKAVKKMFKKGKPPKET